MERIRIARLRADAYLPTRKHAEDAGMDLYAAERVEIPPHQFGIVPTGIGVQIPAGFVGLLKPKGRSNHLLGAGVVDAGYQGEILIKVANPSDEPLVFEPGDAVGQLLILPILTPQIEEISVAEFLKNSTARGASGGIVDQKRHQSSG